MWRRLAIDRLSLKLGLTVTLFVVAGLALGFHLTYTAYRGEILAATRAHAESEARLVRLALSHQMLESDDRTLVRRMVRSFAGDAPVERVMVLDRDGQVKFSSDPTIRKNHFAFTDATCQVCHQHAASDRQRSTVLDLPGGTVLRAVQPIPNEEPCHECHDPKDTMNGVLIVDVPVSATFARMESSLRRLAVGTAVMALVLIAGIGFVFRRFVLRRIRRFEKAAIAMGEGDLAQRVPVEGNDALTRVEVQFNRMAEKVGDLLHRVELQRERLRRVMNSVDDGMVVLDPQLRIVAANDAFVRRFPRHGADMIGRTCLEVIGDGASCCEHADDCPALHCFATRSVQTGIRSRSDPGGARHEEVRASPFLGEEGEVARVVEVWRDITDRRSAEARLAEYQRLASVGMLASGFSHEVNTPLSSIATCLEAIDGICTARGEEGETRRYVQIAADQVQRAAGITRQFLNLARGGTPDREILDLAVVAAHVARLSGPTARLAGVAVEVEARPGLPPVLANGGAVQQVLLNLILNAVEASDRDTRIRVHFREADTVDVLVEDQGHGLQPDDATRVFEPFFTRRASGTGLGLFVSLNLARGWGGDVRVEHSRPGEGTTFAVSFPAIGCRYQDRIVSDALRILVVDDDDTYRNLLAGELSKRGHRVTQAADTQQAREILERDELDVAIVDLRLGSGDGLDVLRHARAHSPRTEVVMLTGHGTIDTAIEAMRAGAFDYLSKPCSLRELEMVLVKARERQHLVERNAVLQDGLAPPEVADSFIGESPAFRRVEELVDRIAPADATAMILGETGVGKEVVARLLHARSKRRGKPLVTVDCTSLHDELLHSELFGHEKGAYTGAGQLRHGLFEVADGGTLFLDEVGDISPTTQTSLLRVLETGTFRHVGGTREIKVDVRIVAATNRDLPDMVRRGFFRSDLYFRLNTLRIEVPPLRERAADVPALAGHFLRRANARFGQEKRFTEPALARLSAYRWPGNVRELLHAVEAAVVLCPGDRIGPEHLPPEIRGPAAADSGLRPLAEVEREHVLAVLVAVGGNRGRAAGILGISERTLYRKLRDYGEVG